jgi:hypothetical protein
VWAEIQLFRIGTVVDNSKHETQEAVDGWGRDIYIDNPVAHFKISQEGRTTIEQEAFAALKFSQFGLTLQIPAGRVRGNDERLRGMRRLGMGRGLEEKDNGTKSEMSNRSWLAHMLPLGLHRGRFHRIVLLAGR